MGINNQGNNLISVIIPVYNVEKYLKKSIDSVLNQTFQNFEIILVDDGSTDNSGIICDEYAEKDNRIKVVHQKNAGVSVARNLGIEKSKGNYICFLDSDDWYSNNALEEFIKLITDFKADIAAISVFETSDEHTDYMSENKINVFNNSEAMTQLFKNALVFGTACNKLYKREIFNSIKFPKNLYWEDMYISLDVLINISKITWSKKACLYYRQQRKDSTTSSRFSKRNLDEYYAIKHVEETTRKINRMDLWIKNNYRCLNYLMSTYIKIEKSEFLDKNQLMNDYKIKINKLFKSMPFLRWSLKNIKRYLFFKISPQLYEFLILKNK